MKNNMRWEYVVFVISLILIGILLMIKSMNLLGLIFLVIGIIGLGYIGNKIDAFKWLKELDDEKDDKE